MVVTDARTCTMFLQRIGRVAHAFHGACHSDIHGTSLQRFCRHDSGLHAGAAHLIHGGRLYRFWQAAVQGRLPCWRLAQSSRQHAPHIDALNSSGRHQRPLHGGAHGRSTDLRSREGSE